MTRDYTKSVMDIKRKFEDSSYVYDLYTGQLEDLHEKYKKGLMTAKEYSEAVKQIQDAYKSGAFGEEAQKKALDELTKAYKDAKNKMLLDILEMKFMADGIFSDEEFNVYIKAMLDFGMINERDIARLRELYNQAGGLASTARRASGGHLGSGWTMVGERGFELISPAHQVYSHEQSMSMMRSGAAPRHFQDGGILSAPWGDTKTAKMLENMTQLLAQIAWQTAPTRQAQAIETLSSRYS